MITLHGRHVLGMSGMPCASLLRPGRCTAGVVLLGTAADPSAANVLCVPITERARTPSVSCDHAFRCILQYAALHMRMHCAFRTRLSLPGSDQGQIARLDCGHRGFARN